MPAAPTAPRTRPRRSAYDFRALLTYRLLVLSNTLGKGAIRLYAGRYGVPLAEWRLLAALALEAPISVNALASALRADKGWISRVVGALAGKGLAEVGGDAADARRVRVQLTDPGRALYARILPAAIARQRKLVSVLSPVELRTLDRLLEKLQQQADRLLEIPESRPARKAAAAGSR